MPDPEVTPKPEGIEVKEPVIKKGTVQFMNKAGFKNPAPQRLKVILTTIRYFCAGVVTLIGGSVIFTGNQSKVFCFILGVVVLATGAIEMATGVQSNADAMRELENKKEE